MDGRSDGSRPSRTTPTIVSTVIGSGSIGFFESVDDQRVANALFAAAAAWLRARGCDTMRGPMSPSINDECGLLVDGFETPPTLMMPHNPPYYAALHDGYGLVKAKDLWVYESPAAALPEHLKRIARAVQLVGQRQGITLRALDMTRFAAEVEMRKGLYNAAWEKNWGFVPMTDAEIDHLAKQLKPIVVPDLVCFAERAATVDRLRRRAPRPEPGAAATTPPAASFPASSESSGRPAKSHASAFSCSAPSSNTAAPAWTP